MNNYKGVMLCSRPSEPVKIAIEKPFCSRVEAPNQLGLNPVLKENNFPADRRKKVNIAMKRHKEWLDIYKLKMNLKKEDEQEKLAKELDTIQKVKEIGERGRERIKRNNEGAEYGSYIKSNSLEQKDTNYVNNQLENGEEIGNQSQLQNDENYITTNLQNSKISIPNNTMKKEKNKPKWAQTEKELKEKEDQECDDLLNFVNNLDYDQYINDLEVQSMVKAIKHRITDLKVQEESQWKQKALSNLKSLKNQANKEVHEKNQDELSQCSAVSESKSVHSEKSQQSIQQLKEKASEIKKGKTDWDSSSQADKNKVSIEERIAKHVADEVLRNYKHLGIVHSNQSIRKLLEREAHSYISKDNQQ